MSPFEQIPSEAITVVGDDLHMLAKLLKFRKVNDFYEMQDCAPVGVVICLTAYLHH